MGKEKSIKRTKKVPLTEEEILKEKEAYLDSVSPKYNSVHFEIPFIPPSVNDLYFNNPRTGGRSLTTEGGVYKLRVKEYLTTNYLDEIQSINPRSMFSLKMFFNLPKEDLFTQYLTNKKTKSPFKRRDLGNMEKILVDCIKEFCITDDCQIFEERLLKNNPGQNIGVVVWLAELDPRGYTNDIDVIYKLTRYREDASAQN